MHRMHRMHRHTVLAGLLALVACTSGNHEDPPPTVYQAAPIRELATPPQAGPEPPRARPSARSVVAPHPRECVPSTLASGTLEFVRQQPLPLPDHFDPGGVYGAVNAGVCEVWELDSGVLLGSFGTARDSGTCVRWPGGDDPCVSWPELEALALHGANPVRTSIKAKGVELVVEGHLARALVDGEERYRFACDPNSYYVAVSLDHDEVRIAAARPHAIELREFATGALIAELPFDKPTPPGGELETLGLGWSESMPFALLGRVAECGPEVAEQDCEFSGWSDEDQPVWELRRWSSTNAVVEAERITWETDDDTLGWIDDASVDPLGRWLFVVLNWGAGHDQPWERRQIPLTAEAARRRVDLYTRGYDGVEFERDVGPWGLGEDTQATPRWVIGNRSARAWSLTQSHYDGESNGSDDLAWASVELWPDPRLSGPHELASDYSVEAQTLDVFGVAAGEGVLAWSHCFSGRDRASLMDDVDRDDIGDDLCRGSSPVPRGCEARGVSDDLDWLLVSCGPAWRLVPLGPAAAALDPVELAGAKDGSVTAVFGRSGLALASQRGGLQLLSPSGQRHAVARDIVELVPALLGPELDRVVGRDRSGATLVVFDLASGQRLASIATTAASTAPTSSASAPVPLLAFAPDGRRLAVSDGRRVTVHAGEAMEVASSWDAGQVLGLAWRQDGAVVYTGLERALPERAWDPATGTLAATQPDPFVVERLASADIDPSWRWAFEGDDVIVRVIDGLALYLEAERWIVTETGFYDSLKSLDGHPRDPDPLYVHVAALPQPSVRSLAELPARLRHPGLLRDFLAGEPLPRPRLDATELAALGPGRM